VVEANLLAMKTDNPKAFGKVYNVGTGKQTSLNQLFLIIKNNLIDIYSRRGQLENAVDLKLIEARYAPFRKNDIRYSFACIEESNRYLEYYPKVSMNIGLFYSCQYYYLSER
jgi:nucleoside-diphosphate-sugar epimerase